MKFLKFLNLISRVEQDYDILIKYVRLYIALLLRIFPEIVNFCVLLLDVA